MSEPLADLRIETVLDMSKVNSSLDKLKKSIRDANDRQANADWQAAWIRRAENVNAAARSMVRALGSVGTSLKTAGGGFSGALKTGFAQGIGVGVFNSLTHAVTTAITAPFRGLGQSILDSSEIEVVERKFKNVFGDMVVDADKFARSYAAKIGQSSTSIKSAMARLQDTFIPMGFDRKQSAGMTKTMTALATDLAANEGISVDESMQRIISGISGNHEALRLFIGALTEATLKEKLLAMGIQGGTAAATEQQKVLARMAILLERTSDAHGMAGKAAGTFANELSGFRGMLFEVSAAIGDVFKPAATAILKFLRESLVSIKPNIEAFKEWGVTIGKSVSESLSVVIDWVKYATSSSQGLLDTLSMVGDVLEGSADVGFAWIAETGIKTVGAIGGAIMGMLGYSGKEIKEIFRDVGDQVAVILDSFEETIKRIRILLGMLNPHFIDDTMELMGFDNATTSERMAARLKLLELKRKQGNENKPAETWVERTAEGAKAGWDGMAESLAGSWVEDAMAALRRSYDLHVNNRDLMTSDQYASMLGANSSGVDYKKALEELRQQALGLGGGGKNNRATFGTIAEMQKDLQSKIGGKDDVPKKQLKEAEKTNQILDKLETTLGEDLRKTLDKMTSLGTLG